MPHPTPATFRAAADTKACIVLLLFALFGCSSPPKSSLPAEVSMRDTSQKTNEPDSDVVYMLPQRLPDPPAPRINSIGTQAILTFDKNIAPEGDGIVIPIEGFGMDGTVGRGIYLQVSGTVQLSSADYSWNLASNKTKKDDGRPDLAEIILKGRYVRQLRTGDRIEVLIGLQRGQLGSTQPPSLAYAHRTFTVYELEDYRKQVIPARVPPHDIQAFPLPQEEATYLFGATIARSYFVVRLTLRNSQGEDKLVNTGMISATGRAIVVPINKADPTFTVPVKISPQGPIQVFAVLDDQEMWRGRAWVFRSLEFIGTLASAGVNSFSSSVASEWKKTTSLYNGVFLPEAKKLWPDGWPGYKRNLVSFSMPELTKIPRQSTTSPKYVFFAKRDLELIVSDPSLFQRGNVPFINLMTERLPSRGPEVRVISLAFDNLEVPFEQVTTPGTEDSVDLLGRAQSAVDQQLERLRSLARAWEGQAFVTTSVKFAALETSATQLRALAGKPDADLQTAKLQPAVKSLSWLATELVKAKQASGAVHDLLLQDSDLNGFGLRSLEARKDELQSLTRRVLANSDSKPLQDQLTKIQQTAQASDALLQFVDSAAEILTSKTVTDAVMNLTSALPKAADASTDRDTLQRAYATLKNTLTVPVLKEFASSATDPATPVAPANPAPSNPTAPPIATPATSTPTKE